MCASPGAVQEARDPWWSTAEVGGRAALKGLPPGSARNRPGPPPGTMSTSASPITVTTGAGPAAVASAVASAVWSAVWSLVSATCARSCRQLAGAAGDQAGGHGVGTGRRGVAVEAAEQGLGGEPAERVGVLGDHRDARLQDVGEREVVEA